MCRLIFGTLAIVGLVSSPASAAPGTPLPFAEEIHSFAVEDEVYPPTGCETLFVGSSSIRFWTRLRQDFNRYRIIQRGFGGAQISDIETNFDAVVGQYRPQRIVFYAGENDIDAGLSAHATMARFRAFLDRKTAALGATPVFFVSVKPSFARAAQLPVQTAFNEMVENLARERADLAYVDVVRPMMNGGGLRRAMFISDGLHMKASGYAIWKKAIQYAIAHTETSRAPTCR